MRNVKVSVIMPTYNHAMFIAESIESVLAQTFPDWELIIVNDASTDNTSEVIGDYAHRFPSRVRIVNKETNGGTTLALNDALALCTGQYIGWLSSDDLYSHDCLEKQIEVLEEQNAGMAFGAWDMIDENGNFMESVKYDFSEKNIYRELLRYCPESCTMLIRKECFETVGQFDPRYRYSQDYDMWLRIAAQFKVICNNGTMGSKRIHRHQLTNLGVCEICGLEIIGNFVCDNNHIGEFLEKAKVDSAWPVLLDTFSSFYWKYANRPDDLEKLNTLLENWRPRANGTDGNGASSLRKIDALQDRIRLLMRNPVVADARIFDWSADNEIIKRACIALKAAAIVINKPAIRFDRCGTKSVGCLIARGLPHENTFVIVSMPVLDAAGYIEKHSKTTFSYGNFPSRGMARVAVSSYMLRDPDYGRDLAGHEIHDTGKKVREVIYDEIYDLIRQC
ncbi:MAG: glycosyltransferase [Syntrophobacteraceae bacterium]